MWSGVIAAVATAAFSLGLTYLVRAAAHRLGIVAAPRKDRWHQRPTALMGGVAIYLSFLAGLAIFAPSLNRAMPILLPATLLFITGAVDDRIQLKPYIKLAMQIIASAMTVTAGLDLQWTDYGAINSIITIFWLVGITNAVNLLDNMDGLAGGVSFISCLFLTITFSLNGQTEASLLPLLLAGAVAGFLAFNLKPASIFMGDCGSMFLGFVLGGTALLSDAGRMRNLLGVMLTPALILMIPIFDTCFVAIRRKLHGRAVSQGGRDHTSHHLVALGMSERRAVYTLYGIAVISGTLALLVRELSVWVGLALITGFALFVASLGLFLGKVRVYEEGEKPSGILVDVLGNFSHRRRVIEILLDTFLVVFAYYLAYLLRFDGEMPGEQRAIFMKTLPIVVAIQIFLFLAGGVYRGIWRYTGVDDLVRIARSVFVSAAISGASILAMYKMHGPSRAVLILNGLILLFLIGLSRLSFRLLAIFIRGDKTVDPNARPVLIYGAGDGGEILVRELLNNPDYYYHPVGFIDDDEQKKGKILRGCRVFSSSELPDLITSHGVKDVLISSIKVPESKLEDLRNLGVGLKRLRILLD
jgi:UDP-GlcNAc:undecaprenyl-phosphate/decaprenyl-phosphate GlcNAc-1-phosphate transferase